VHDIDGSPLEEWAAGALSEDKLATEFGAAPNTMGGPMYILSPLDYRIVYTLQFTHKVKKKF
jgi:hypothetical protein